MKKFYTLLATLGVTASMAAQQLPNAGFEEDWTATTPWDSNDNTITEGKSPSPWTIAHVIGMSGTGATTVGNKVAGFKSESAVELKNTEIKVLFVTKTIPGYITLGTPWNTAEGMSAKNKDGGSFGGIDFKYRPDAMSFDYKRSNASSASSTVIAYTWKGHWTQKDVPGAVSMGRPKKYNMVDRDRCVLGYSMDGCQGGDVTKTDDAALIAKIIYEINEDQTEWNNIEIPFTYVDEAQVPESLNVIFSAGDYFTTDPVKDYALTVDNVKLVYYSRLSGLKFKDADIADFDPDKFDYALDEVMPTDEAALEATTMGNSGVAKAAVELDQQKNVATITVTNDHGNDADDQNSHVYTVKFLPAGSSINDVIDMTSADVRYVDLYGNAVAADALVNGQTYIKLVNGKATKVIANN